MITEAAPTHAALAPPPEAIAPEQFGEEDPRRTLLQRRRSPYVGLLPFQEADRLIFFGREHHVEQLLKRIARENQHFVAIVGESGCGKSSVVRAGLLPQLRAGRLIGAGSYWRDVTFTPGGGDPFAACAAALTPKLHGVTDADVIDELRKGNVGGLLRASGNDPSSPGHDTRWLVVVDQFEELFDQGTETALSREFVRFLVAAIDEPNVFVAITLRAERVGDCARFDRLTKAVFSGLYLVPPLEISELRQAIRSPALMFGCEVQEDLITALINDSMRRDRDYLPLLQHALTRIWEESCGGQVGVAPQVLTLMDYQKASAGATGADLSVQRPLQCELDKHYKTLLAGEHPVAAMAIEHLFRRLIFTPRNERAVSHSVRSIATLEELAQLLQPPGRADLGLARRIIELFRERDFLIPLSSECPRLEPSTQITLCHESLIRQWIQLEEWTREEARAANTFHQLLDATEAWTNTAVSIPTRPDALPAAQRWRDDILNHDVWAQRYLSLEECSTATSEESRSQRILRYIKALEQAVRAKARRPWYVGAAIVGVMSVVGVLVAHTRHEEHVQHEHEQLRTKTLLEADAKAYTALDASALRNASARLDSALDGYSMVRNLHEPDTAAGAPAITSEALRTVMWTDSLRWQNLHLSAADQNRIVARSRALLSSGFVLAGATQSTFVFISPVGQRIELPVCSAFANRVNQQLRLVAVSYPDAAGFAISEVDQPRACFYPGVTSGVQGIPLQIEQPGALGPAPSLDFAHDGHTAAFWSKDGRIILFPLAQIGPKSARPLDFSECREPRGAWELHAVVLANANTRAPYEVVAIGSASEGHIATDDTARLCSKSSASDPRPMNDFLHDVSRSLGPNAVAFSRDSQYVLTVARDKVHVFSTQSRDRSGTLFAYTEFSGDSLWPVESAMFLNPNSDERFRALINHGDLSYVWVERQDGSVAPPLPTQLSRHSSLRVLDLDRRLLLETREDSSARVWDLESETPYAEIARMPKASAVGYNNETLVVTPQDPTEGEFALSLSSLAWHHPQTSDSVVVSGGGTCRIRAIGEIPDHPTLGVEGTSFFQNFETEGTDCTHRRIGSMVHGGFASIYGISDDGRTLFGQTPVEELPPNVQDSSTRPLQLTLVDFDKLPTDVVGHTPIGAPSGPPQDANGPRALTNAGALSPDGLRALAIASIPIQTMDPGEPASQLTRVYFWERDERFGAFTPIKPLDVSELSPPIAVGTSRTARFAVMGDSDGVIQVVTLDDRNHALSIAVRKNGLLSQPIRQIGINDDGSALIAAYTNGAITIIHCDWKGNTCSQLIRSAPAFLHDAGPFIFDGPNTNPADLHFRIPVHLNSFFGNDQHRILEISCSVECSADSLVLTADAQQRRDAWKSMEAIPVAPPPVPPNPPASASRSP